MTQPRVLVTRRWPEAVEAAIANRFDAIFNESDRPLSNDDFKLAFKEVDAILPTVTDRIGASLFDAADSRTRILANYGVGFNHIDVDAARGHGVVVTNTPDVLSECTADLTMTLMLMAARRVSEGEREVRDGQWSGWRPTHLLGTKISGKTLGLVGFGRIGREVARRAHHGFGMTVKVFNRSPVDPAVLQAFGAEQVASLDELLPQCDVVSLHCQGGADNRHLIDARRLNQMKPTAYLINTARGEVVDEQALAQALWFETIAGAGLDVYDGEPTVHPDLRACDNAVLLPHLGSATFETREAMGFRVIENLQDFFAGRSPRDRVI